MVNVIDTLKAIDAASFKNEDERRKAVSEAYALLSRIESAWDTTCRLVMTSPPQLAALRTANDLGLFTNWLAENDGGPMSLEKLCSMVHCDTMLLTRVIRHLGATNTLWTDEQGRYIMTPFAKGLVSEDMAAGIDFYFDVASPAASHIPALFKQINYQNPTGAEDNYKASRNQTLWEYLGSDPVAAAAFSRWMKASSAKRGNFTELYPSDDLTCEADEVLLVDIAGNLGHDIQGFRTHYPNAGGKLILQDLPEVIESVKTSSKLDPSIETQVYDFFTPQLVKHAKIYLLHAILHDWDDANAKRILETLRPAMKAGHSKLLIHEIVVPEIAPDVESTSRDWVMMYLLSGAERTEDQWRRLITSAGYKINKIWRNPLYAESVIETEVA